MLKHSEQVSPILDSIIQSLPGFTPEFILMGAFVLSIFSGLLLDRIWRHTTFCLTLLAFAIATGFISLQLDTASLNPNSLFMGMLKLDSISVYARILIAASCFVFTLLVHWNLQFKQHKKRVSDLYTILLGIAIGLNLMTMSSHWLMIYLAIEMVSIGSYIMVSYLSRDSIQTESAMKYVLFGLVCSAVMLYGISLLYGLTGNLDFSSIQHISGLGTTNPFVATFAVLLVFVGIGFKLSFVPFHFWTPDVYEGAPTPITAFLSTTPKIAGIILLSRLLIAWPTESGEFAQYMHNMLLLATIGTLLFGNLGALRQQHIKRLMAYSSIGHTGFLLMAVIAYTTQENASVLLFYLAVYTVMNMGVFILIDYIESRTGAIRLDEYKGLGSRLPLAFVCFVILLVSLTGLPPTAGFVGKLLVFSSVLDNWRTTGHTGMLLLLITGAITTVVSLFFYFKVPLNAFLRKSDRVLSLRYVSQGMVWAFILFSIAMLVLGILPQLLINRL